MRVKTLLFVLLAAVSLPSSKARAKASFFRDIFHKAHEAKTAVWHPFGKYYLPKDESEEEQCRSFPACSGRFELDEIRKLECALDDGTLGLRCPTVRQSDDLRFPPPPAAAQLLPYVPAEKVRSALRDVWPGAGGGGGDEEASSGRWSSRGSLFKPTKKAIEIGKQGMASVVAGQRLRDAGFDPASFAVDKRAAVVDDLACDCECEFESANDEIDCAKEHGGASAAYRTVDGSCNNLNGGFALNGARVAPIIGRANTPVQRFVPASYDDGIYAPRSRRSSGDGNLPEVRQISNELAKDSGMDSDEFTVLFMLVGQFIDHDMMHMPFHQAKNGTELQCCSDGDKFRSECFPIPLKPDDKLSRISPTPGCMNFARSQVSMPLDCAVGGPGQQLNQVTHWLDASTVYGSDEEELCKVVTGDSKKCGEIEEKATYEGPWARKKDIFQSGKGSLATGSSLNLLPDCNEHCEKNCCTQKDGFIAGDSRVNENPGLAAVHTLLFREHNRIAHELRRVNPHWQAKRVFQESRRIVIAEYQHIIFNEWLPCMIGRWNTDLLLPPTDGFSRLYSDEFDPRVHNEFATAAFRTPHSLIPATFRLNDVSSESTDNFLHDLKLEDLFRNVSLLRQPGGLSQLLKGITLQPAHSMDNGFVDDITQRLFDFEDLISLNLQRGRDHGIPGYIHYRKLAGIDSELAQSFDDLRNGGVMSDKAIGELRMTYDSVADIDLFIGLVCERSYRAIGAIAGRSTVAMVGDQFLRLKAGDRFFYDLKDQAGSFTLEQLDEIRRVSLSRLICDNSDIDKMQPLALRLPENNGFNRIRACPSLPKVDLSKWRDGGRWRDKWPLHFV